MFQHPYIDMDEWRDQPVRHRYVHGGFEGTDTRFSFYLPPTAVARKGIQPVVTLTVHGGEKAVVKAGEAVRFEGVISVPPQAGQVTFAEFDFEGQGRFADKANLEPINEPNTQVKAQSRHRYETPGTYFAVLRAASARSGDRKEVFAQIRNLARVRVVVE